MRLSLKTLPAALLIAAIGITAVAVAPPRQKWEGKAAKRKAQDLYYEAQTAYALEDYGRYLTLVQRAFELDSTDPGITNEWALTVMTAMQGRDTLPPTGERAYNYLRNNFLSNPVNYHSGEALATVARGLGRYDDMVRAWEVLDSVFPSRTDTPLNLAQAYLYSSHYGDTAAFGKAMAIYDRLEQGSGKTPEIATYKIRAYMSNDDTLGIKRELSELTAAAGGDARTWLLAGSILGYLGDSTSIDYLNRACELDSANGDAYLMRAEYYRDRGDSLAYDREVFHALESRNLEVESKLEILRNYVVELYADTAQRPRITQLFDHLQRVNAGEAQIHNLYGSYLIAIGDYPAAEEQYTYSVSLDASDPTGWYGLVQAASLAEDHATVMRYAPQAMEREPDELYFPIILANTYRLTGEPRRGLALLDSVDVSVVRNPVAVANLITVQGDIHAAVGDTLQAIERYEKAIEINPEGWMAMNNAAYFMAECGLDLDKAKEYSAQTLAHEFANPTYLDTYAWILFKLKDYKEAKKYIDVALVIYMDDDESDGEDTDGDTGDTGNTGNIEDAEEADDVEAESALYVSDWLRSHTAADSDASYEIYDHAGDIYFMNGEPQTALRFWQMAHELNPDDEMIARKVKHKTIFLK